MDGRGEGRGRQAKRMVMVINALLKGYGFAEMFQEQKKRKGRLAANAKNILNPRQHDGKQGYLFHQTTINDEGQPDTEL